MKIRRDKLDILFSKYIRLRAKGYCEKCGAFKGTNRLECSHFFGRGNKSVRWNESNACALCFTCHCYFTANPLEHVQWFRARLGEEKFAALQQRLNNTHPKPDKAAIEFELTLKLKELDGKQSR